jgi:hypothetical protein
MTFIEVILGVVLVGMVAGTLAATVGAVSGSFQRQRDRLGAAELASRLLIYRVDDEAGLPDQMLPLGYGEREFRWSMEENPTIFTLSEPARAEIEQSGRSGGVDMSRRIKAVTVRVWLAEDSGGSYVFTRDVPHAVLTRLIDPLSFATHDSAERRLDTQQDIERFLQDFVGTTGGTVNRPRNDRGGDRSGRPRPDPGGGGGGDG